MTPATRVFEALQLAGCRPRWTVAGILAHCPAHDDEHPSLSVIEREGRVVLTCFAGCRREDILRRLGLSLDDLTDTPTRQRVRTPATTHPSTPTPRTYPTLQAALEAVGLGPPTATWTYTTEAGETVFVVARWDGERGKEFRPVRPENGQWVISHPPGLRPLYRLHELAAARVDEPVVVVEGEKCADAVRQLGFLVTTSSGGAASARRSDWTPLAGREVWVIPDNDDAGRVYAMDVTQLAYEAGAKTVRILPLDYLFPKRAKELPEHGDIADILALLRSRENGDIALAKVPGWIRERALGRPPEPRPQNACTQPNRTSPPSSPAPPTVTEAEASGSVDAEGEDGQSAGWQPYPTEALPSPLAEFVTERARVMDVDDSFVALPLLTVMGAAIGVSRILRVGDSWAVPPVLWSMIIGESGSGKSSAISTAARLLEPMERQWESEFREAEAAYKAAVEVYEVERKRWQKARARGIVDDPPRPPQPPSCRRILVQNTTVEAVAQILRHNPRGILLCHDELAGWLGSFDRYVNTRGGDSAFWASCYGAGPLRVDRCSGERVYVPRAAVWITGGIQPTVVRTMFTDHLRAQGLLARFLVTYPPRRRKRWKDRRVDETVTTRVRVIVERLLSRLEADVVDGAMEPRVVYVDDCAIREYERFYNENADRQLQAAGQLAASLSKLEETALRLSLIIHLVRWAAGEAVDPSRVDADSMSRAIRLTTWHIAEAERLVAWLERGEDQIEDDRLVEWIKARGGRVTVRDVTHGLWQYRNRTEDAEHALQRLARRGLGRFVTSAPSREGGRPTTIFELVSSITITKTP